MKTEPVSSDIAPAAPRVPLSALDPISLHVVADPARAPFVSEGGEPRALTLYFKSEGNRAEYLDLGAAAAAPSKLTIDARPADLAANLFSHPV